MLRGGVSVLVDSLHLAHIPGLLFIRLLVSKPGHVLELVGIRCNGHHGVRAVRQPSEPTTCMEIDIQECNNTHTCLGSDAYADEASTQ